MRYAIGYDPLLVTDMTIHNVRTINCSLENTERDSRLRKSEPNENRASLKPTLDDKSFKWHSCHHSLLFVCV